MHFLDSFAAARNKTVRRPSADIWPCKFPSRGAGRECYAICAAVPVQPENVHSQAPQRDFLSRVASQPPYEELRSAARPSHVTKLYMPTHSEHSTKLRVMPQITRHLQLQGLRIRPQS